MEENKGGWEGTKEHQTMSYIPDLATLGSYFMLCMVTTEQKK